MIPITASLALIITAFGLASANPIAPRTLTIPLIKSSTKSQISSKDVVARDKSRIAKYNGVQSHVGAQTQLSSGSATNADVSYLATLTFGSNSFSLIVDTGSSNTWAGARGGYSPGSTGVKSGGTVSVTYGSGSFKGNEYNDKVCFAGLCVASQSVGIATSSTGFDGVDGIFGVGPVILTQGTVSGLSTVPTFLDNLKSQGSIAVEALGVYFKPETGSDTADANGELTLGGADSSKYSGSLVYFPKSTSGSFQYYWGVDVSSVTFGSTSLISANGAIVDTGTTLIYIPTTGYNRFLSATGGTTDSSSGLSRFKTKPTANFVINIGGYSFTLPPSTYLVPTAQYTYFGLSSSYYYSWINDGGSSGVDFIIGQKFLEQFYSVYDTTNSRIGFAARV